MAPPLSHSMSLKGGRENIWREKKSNLNSVFLLCVWVGGGSRVFALFKALLPWGSRIFVSIRFALHVFMFLIGDINRNLIGTHNCFMT